ncbi:DNA polymerase IV [Psychrosphaera ytuae]|uniref:DNA polymerase IV n=1 Tax=Psychrosphaera ytuae TaxID=2820710 RepID=A0A975DB27_9GAMM|nr:DNA polymerase IV [Psychrosphaera ytuae]QTH63489.1 DNA polymerase IV [Psychrosphaera ytuae]
MANRKIIHVDMDAFFVSVEIRDNPALANKPVAVGGRSERRGVLSTCNYIARQFGVSSAMPTAMAIKKCPDLIVVPGRMEVYKETSQTIRQVFEKYTDLIEPLSLDEAYLDVTDCPLFQGSATLIAEQIRQDIFEATGLTASAGIAPIKYIAKIASDLNKPNGQCTITPEQVWDFIETMPLKKIPGVGKVTQGKLEKLNLHTGGDVRRSDESTLVRHFGKYGRVLWQRCHGIDPRRVEVSRIRKSVGVERTFETNISDLGQLKELLKQKLLPELEKRSAKHLEQRTISKIGIKLKFADFQVTTKELKHDNIELPLFFELLEEAVQRGEGKPVRLLGAHIGLQEQADPKPQLALSF